jgi:hypothetical protein
MSATVKIWEQRAHYAVGVMILRYLAEHPGPTESEYRIELESWGLDCKREGGEALRRLGAQPLALAPKRRRPAKRPALVRCRASRDGSRGPMAI